MTRDPKKPWSLPDAKFWREQRVKFMADQRKISEDAAKRFERLAAKLDEAESEHGRQA